MEKDNKYVISRDTYKRIKNMNREQLQMFATDIYLDGMKKAESASLDLDKLRKEIGAIKGIGESRLNEIMDVIQQNIKLS